MAGSFNVENEDLLRKLVLEACDKSLTSCFHAQAGTGPKQMITQDDHTSLVSLNTLYPSPGDHGPKDLASAGT